MSVAITPSPELELLGRAVGLLDDDGEVRPDWFTDPGASLGDVLRDSDQRGALFELLQLVLDRPGPTIDHPDGHTLGDETWLPIAVDDAAMPPAPGLYLVLREPTTGPAAGTVTMAVGVLARHAGQDPMVGLTARLPLLRFDGDGEGLEVLIGSPEATLDLELELAFATPAGPIRTLRVGVAIPTSLDAGAALRVTVGTENGAHTIGTGDDPTEVQDTLLRLLLELIASHEAAPTDELTHLLELLGLLDDEHIPDFPLSELLSQGRAAWTGWLRDLLTDPAARTAAFEHLAGFLGLDDDLLVGAGTPDDPLRLQLLTTPAEVAVTLTVDGDGEVPVVTLGAVASATTTGGGRVGTARLRGEVVRVRFADPPRIDLVPTLRLTGHLAGDGQPLVDLDGQDPAVGVGGLVAGLALIRDEDDDGDGADDGVRLVLQARGVTVGANTYPVLDLTDVDALVAVGSAAAEDLLTTLTDAVEVTDEGRALGVLLGLADPPDRGGDWPHRLSLTALLSDPGRAIVDVHRRAVAADDWGEMADALAVLLWPDQDGPARTGSGTFDDPWLTEVVDDTAGSLTLVTWTVPSGGDGGGPSLHAALRLRLPSAIGTTELRLDLEVGLVTLHLGDGGDADADTEDVRARVLPDARARLRAGGGLSLGDERLRLRADAVAVGARWARGGDPRPTVDVDGLTLRVGDDEQPLPLPTFDPDAGWRYDGQPPWELLEALLGRLMAAVDDERWRELPRLLRWRGAPPDDEALPRLPLRELIEEPLDAVRAWLLDGLTGEHAQQAAARARELVTRMLASDGLDPLRGSGAPDDPWRIPLGTSELELTAAMPRPRPGARFAQLIPDEVMDAGAEAGAGLADTVTIVGGLLDRLAALDPQLAEALRHLPAADIADRLVDLREALDASDGLVAVGDQAPGGEEVEVTGVLHVDAPASIDVTAHLPSGADPARQVIVVPGVAGSAAVPDTDAEHVIELTDPTLPASALDVSDLADEGPWVLVLPTPTSVSGGHADVAERLRRTLDAIGDAVAQPIHLVAHGVAAHAARVALPATTAVVDHLVTVAAPVIGAASTLDDAARAGVRLLVSAQGLVTDAGSTLTRVADGLARLVDGAPTADDGPPRAERVTSGDLAGPDTLPPLPNGVDHTAVRVRLGTETFDRAIAQLVVGLHAGMLDRLGALGPDAGDDEDDDRELRLGLRAHLKRPASGATGVRVAVDLDATLATLVDEPGAAGLPATALSLRVRVDRRRDWLVDERHVRVRAMDLVIEVGDDPRLTLVLHDASVHGVRRTRWRIGAEDAPDVPSEVRTLLRRVMRTLDDAPEPVAVLLEGLGLVIRDAAGELEAAMEPLLELIADPTVALGLLDREALADALDELLAPNTPSPDAGVVLVPLGEQLTLRIDLVLERLSLDAPAGVRFGGLRVSGTLEGDAAGIGGTVELRPTVTGADGGPSDDGPRLEIERLPGAPPGVALRWPGAPGALPSDVPLAPAPAVDALRSLVEVVAPVEIVRAVLEDLADRSAEVAALLEAFGLRVAGRVRAPLRLLADTVAAMTDPEALGDAAGRLDPASLATAVARLAELLPGGGTGVLDVASASARLELPGELRLEVGAVAEGRARVGLRFGDAAETGAVALTGGIGIRAAAGGGVAAGIELDLAVQTGGPALGAHVAVGADTGGAAGAVVTLRLAGSEIPVLPPGQGVDALSALGSVAGDAAMHVLPLALDALAEADEPVGGIVRGIGDATGLRTAEGFDRDAIEELADRPVEVLHQRLASAAAPVLDELLQALRDLAGEVLPDGLPVTLGDVDGEPTVTVDLQLADADTSTLTVSLPAGRPRITLDLGGLQAVDGVAADLSIAVHEGIERFAGGVRVLDADLLRLGGVSLHPEVAVTVPAGDDGTDGAAGTELALTLFTATDPPRQGASARWRFAPVGFAVGAVTDDGSSPGIPDDADPLAALQAVLTGLLLPLSTNLALRADPVRDLLDATTWSGGPSVGEVLDTHLLTREGSDGPYALVPRALELEALPDRLLGVGAQLLGALQTSFPGMEPVTLGVVADGDRLGLSVGLSRGQRLELFDTGEVRLAVEVDDGWFEAAPGGGANDDGGLQLLLLRLTTVAGQLPEVGFDPAVRVRGLGLRLDRPGDAPLVDMGVRLEALALHALWDADLTVGGGVNTDRAGLHLRAHGLAVPLASDDDSNAVAAGLLAADPGDGDAETLRPAFSPSLALLFGGSGGGSGGSSLRFRAGEGDGPWWLPIQRGFGPLYVEQVGIGRTLDAQGELIDLRVLVDGGASLAGLSVGVRELGLVLPWTSLHDVRTWSVTLAGLAVAYDGPGVQIAGGLRKREIVQGGEVVGVDYVGMLRVAFPPYGLTAIGGFGSFAVPGTGGAQRYTSLFVFGALSAPLGGPPAFFVTGIGAGAGLNRRLVAPTAITKVPEFPLVAALDPASDLARDPMGALDRLGETFPPSRGALWFAAGLSFTSFALVDAIALVTVEIDDGLEINLLGLARMELPDALAPIAAVELALQARFSTREGVLSIQAQLTENSWIITRDCRLTGGFAFVIWFAGEHAGQFVLTLGGYHPEFDRPPAFPVPPRLGFAWTPTDRITIKGGAYFALTASCVMAGGDLEISYDGGWAWASLRAGAHLLVAWDPFAFTAEFYIEIRAGVEFRVCFIKCATVRKSFSFGVRLRIEGPELRGRATIDLSVITIQIRFGATGNPRRPDPLDWDTFARRYLDADTNGDPQVVSAAVTDGMDHAGPVEEPGDDAPAHGSRERPWRVTPEFAMVVETTVMTKGVHWRNPGGNWDEMMPGHHGVFRRIVPMGRGLAGSDLTATLSGSTVDLEPVARHGRVPEGLWGLIPVDDDPPADATMLPTLSGLRFDTRIEQLPLDGRVTTVIDDEDVGAPRRNPLVAEAAQSAPGGRLRELRELDERIRDDLVDELGPILEQRARDRLVPGRIGTLFEGIADPTRDHIEVTLAGAIASPSPGDEAGAEVREATVHLDAVLPVDAAEVARFTAARATAPRVPAPTLADAHRGLEVALPAHLEVVERPAVLRGGTLVAADPVVRTRVAGLGRERLSSSLGGDTELAARVGGIDGRAVGRAGQRLRSDQLAVWQVRDAHDDTAVHVSDAPARVIALDLGGEVLAETTVADGDRQPIPAGTHRVVTATAPGTGLLGGWTGDEELPYLGAGTHLIGGGLLSAVTGPLRRGPAVVRAGRMRAAEVVRRAGRSTTRLAGDLTAVAVAIDGATDDVEVTILGAEVAGDGREPVEVRRGERTWLVLEVVPAGEDAVRIEVRVPDDGGRLGGVLGGVLDAEELGELLATGGQDRVRVPLAAAGAQATIRWEGASRA